MKNVFKVMLVLMVLAMPMLSAEINCNPPVSGDWIINSDTRCESREIITPLDSGIIVNSGKHLDLYDVNLKFNISFNLPRGISVNGNLTMTDTVVSTVDLGNVNGWFIYASPSTHDGWINIDRCEFINPSYVHFLGYENSRITKTVMRDNPYDSCSANGKSGQLLYFYSGTVGIGSNITIDGLEMNNISNQRLINYLPVNSTFTNISNDYDYNCITGKLNNRYLYDLDNSNGGYSSLSDFTIYLNESYDPSYSAPSPISFNTVTTEANNIHVEGFTSATYTVYVYGDNSSNNGIKNLDIVLHPYNSTELASSYALYLKYGVNVTNLNFIIDPSVLFRLPARALFSIGNVAYGGYPQVTNLTMTGFPENMSNFSALDYWSADVWEYYQPIIVDQDLNPVENARLEVTSDYGETPTLLTGINGYAPADSDSKLLVYRKNATGTYFYNTTANVYLASDYLGTIPEEWVGTTYGGTTFQITVPRPSRTGLVILKISESTKTMIWIMVFLIPVLTIAIGMKMKSTSSEMFYLAMMTALAVTISVAIVSIL